MKNLQTYITNFVDTNMIPLAVTAIFVALVLVGFAFVLPGKSIKEWAKAHIIWIIIGAAIIYTASSLAVDVAANFGY